MSVKAYQPQTNDQGILWQDLVSNFEQSTSLGMSKETALRYLSFSRIWTHAWNLIPAKEITPQDGIVLIERMRELHYTLAYQINVKKAVCAIFRCGMSMGIITYYTNPMNDVRIKKMLAYSLSNNVIR